MFKLGDVYPETIVAVYDVSGLLIHQLQFKNSKQFEVDIDTAPGVYLISLQLGKRNALFRVIKK